DENVEAEVGALGGVFIGRNHMIDQRLDERGFVVMQELVANRRRRRTLLSLCGFSQIAGSCCRSRAAGHGALKEITAPKFFVCHVLLPLAWVRTDGVWLRSVRIGSMPLQLRRGKARASWRLLHRHVETLSFKSLPAGPEVRSHKPRHGGEPFLSGQ